MAKLIVNGEDQKVQLPATVADLIKQNNVAQPDMVSVQVNEEFVDREEFATLQWNECDAVDFLYFMGGGQDKESIEYRF
jgi:sulfur carrier protein